MSYSRLGLISGLEACVLGSQVPPPLCMQAGEYLTLCLLYLILVIFLDWAIVEAYRPIKFLRVAWRLFWIPAPLHQSK